jgi:hypothetical protein
MHVVRTLYPDIPWLRKAAQRRIYIIEAAPIAELDAWLVPYRRLWNYRLDALGRHLDNPKEN